MNLWNGGTSVWEPNRTCVLVCRENESESEDESEEKVSSEGVALVADPALARLFISAPALLVCSDILREAVEAGNVDGLLYQRAVEALADLDFVRSQNQEEIP